jgi:hypothetical protein
MAAPMNLCRVLGLLVIRTNFSEPSAGPPKDAIVFSLGLLFFSPTKRRKPPARLTILR